MSHKTEKGGQVPDAGDSLLNAWAVYDRSVGTINRFDSIAAMRTAISAADAAGYPPTLSNPWYGDINGNIYRCTGVKGNNDVWDLKIINEVEYYGGSYGAGEVKTLVAEETYNLVDLDVPVKPYDRIFKAWGQAWGNIASGTIVLVARIGDTAGARAAFNADDGTGSSATVSNRLVVKAGVKPDVRMAIAGGSQGGKVTLSTNPLTTRYLVECVPITMS